MKKTIAMILCLLMVVSLFAGCGGKGDSGSAGTTAAPAASNNEAPAPTEAASVHTGGARMDHQVDRVISTASSTSINVGPFAPSSPGTVGKFLLYASLFWAPKFGCSEEEMVPWIAKSYKQIDSKNFEIEIFDYVKDSKGNPITIDDVIWSINKSIEIGQFVDGGSNIVNMEKIDDYHMKMEIATDAPNTFAMLVTNARLYIVNQKWWEGATDDEKQNDPACTGPYTVREFIPGSGATMVANDNYWQTDEAMNDLLSPAYRNVKEVVFTAITEASMRVIALENNEVDIAMVSASDLGIFYDFDTNQPKDGWCVDVAPLTYVHSLFPNMDSSNLVGSNLELRKAIFYAIDPAQLIVASGNNSLTARPVTCSVTSAYAGYQEAWDSQDYYAYNPEKAAECLAAAGYKPGEVTIRLLSSSSLYNDSVRSVIISELGAVGINVENVTVEQALFSTYKNDPTVWDLMIDLKSSTTGHVASYYDYNFSAANYQNGGVNFCKDEELYKRVNAVMADPSDENIQAVEQYIEDNAILYALFSNGLANVGQKGILEMGTAGTQIIPASCVFADDYKSAG